MSRPLLLTTKSFVERHAKIISYIATAGSCVAAYYGYEAKLRHEREIERHFRLMERVLKGEMLQEEMDAEMAESREMGFFERFFGGAKERNAVKRSITPGQQSIASPHNTASDLAPFMFVIFCLTGYLIGRRSGLKSTMNTLKQAGGDATEMTMTQTSSSGKMSALFARRRSKKETTAVSSTDAVTSQAPEEPLTFLSSTSTAESSSLRGFGSRMRSLRSKHLTSQKRTRSGSSKDSDRTEGFL